MGWSPTSGNAEDLSQYDPAVECDVNPNFEYFFLIKIKETRPFFPGHLRQIGPYFVHLHLNSIITGTVYAVSTGLCTFSKYFNCSL